MSDIQYFCFRQALVKMETSIFVCLKPLTNTLARCRKSFLLSGTTSILWLHLWKTSLLGENIEYSMKQCKLSVGKFGCKNDSMAAFKQ